MGNLFIEEVLQLVSIPMKDVMDTPVVNSVQNVPKIREEEEQFENFVKEGFIKRSKLITDPLKKNKQKKILENCALFARLHMTCQKSRLQSGGVRQL